LSPDIRWLAAAAVPEAARTNATIAITVELDGLERNRNLIPHPSVDVR
jgi:predicted RNase H-like HicB family nuclease